jgi:flagellar basal body-associated protein FliL
MNADTSVTIVFLVVLLVMVGAAYSYYLLEKEAKEQERKQPDRIDAKQSNRTRNNEDANA